jgi:hypothetical protein
MQNSLICPNKYLKMFWVLLEHVVGEFVKKGARILAFIFTCNACFGLSSF